MRATKEYRAWMKRMVQWRGKKNGVVPGALLDNPWMERKLQSGRRSIGDGKIPFKQCPETSGSSAYCSTRFKV